MSAQANAKSKRTSEATEVLSSSLGSTAPTLHPRPTEQPEGPPASFRVVGLRGFEPPTFGPPDRRANQAAPQPALNRSPYRSTKPHIFTLPNYLYSF